MIYNLILEVNMKTKTQVEAETLEKAMHEILDKAGEYYDSYPMVEVVHLGVYEDV